MQRRGKLSLLTSAFTAAAPWDYPEFCIFCSPVPYGSHQPIACEQANPSPPLGAKAVWGAIGLYDGFAAWQAGPLWVRGRGG